MSLPIQAYDLFQEFEREGFLNAMHGEDREIRGISSRETCGPGDLVFIDRADALEPVLARSPAALVIGPDLLEAARQTGGDIVLFVAGNVGVAHALIRQRHHAPDPHASEWGPRHESALVHETAELGAGVVLGPYVVIGAQVSIGANSVVMAGSVVERGARLGADCVIHPNSVIGYDCVLGDRVVVKSGSVIGSEGYGFAQDQKQRSYRIPQTGRVVLGDDVEIGANNCIDRATYGETSIGRGTKFDNFCHVAHNVTIGEDCLITAAFVVAGSTRIGDRVIASGQTGIIDHLTVADDVILVHRAAVMDNIEEPGIYAGNPAQPLQPYLKNSAIFRNLNDMRKRIGALEKSLAAQKKSDPS